MVNLFFTKFIYIYAYTVNDVYWLLLPVLFLHVMNVYCFSPLYPEDKLCTGLSGSGTGSVVLFACLTLPHECKKMLLYPFRCTHRFENSEFGGLKDLPPARAFLLVLSLGGRWLLFLFLESKACYCIETCDCLHSVNYGY